ncbi:MAG: sigma-70 family RNA polymerase sigma factor, partial [Actinomycetota bacterium]|nr:sigma-70 family RNA polymerase sigma factor [Actinomycetota bacterium]
MAGSEHLLEVADVGDEQFNGLYRQWYRPVVRLCERRLGEGADAEAIAQEAFVRAWSSWEQYAPDRPFGPWVTVIALRLCSTETRITRRRQAILGHGIARTSEIGEEPVQRAVQSYGVHRAFRSLPSRSRRLIFLRDVEGHSYDEIAELDGTTVEAVRGALRRARAVFRAAYSDAVGAPAAVGSAATSVVRRALEGVSSRLAILLRPGASVLEPAAAVLMILALPASTGLPAPEPVAPSTVAASTAVPGLSAAATNATTRNDGVVPALASVVDATSAASLDVGVETSAPEGPVGLPFSAGQNFSFTPSPAFEEDGTVYALGQTSGTCRVGECAVLLQSRDGGLTWQRLPGEGLAPGRILLPPAYPRDGRLFAATKEMATGIATLSVSEDGGRSFSDIGVAPGAVAMS